MEQAVVSVLSLSNVIDIFENLLYLKYVLCSFVCITNHYKTSN